MAREDITRNLDTQRRRLDDLDAAIDAALSDDDEAPLPRLATDAPRHQTYDELTTTNDALRELNGWSDIDLDAALTDSQRAALDRWRQRHRMPWTNADLAAVGAAGIVGVLCSWFDTTIDKSTVKAFKNNVDISGWEAAGKRLPIDYMGPGFGGRHHRIKSAGHDPLRAIEALRQIKAGEFRGIAWIDGQPIPVVRRDQFRSVDTWTEALIRLVKHLGADVVTSMSLPVPGMSYIANAKNEALREFARHAYQGLRPGEGVNIRSSLILPAMPVFLTEVIIRTHVHGEALHTTGSFRLDEPRTRRRNELLLAAHSLVAAVSVIRTGASSAAMMLTGNHIRAFHPAQLRHINIPALIRTATLAVTVTRQEAQRRTIPTAPTWHELLTQTAQTAHPWQLTLGDHINQNAATVDATDEPGIVAADAGMSVEGH